MKNAVLLFITIFILSSVCAFAQDSKNERKNAYKLMTESNKYHHDVCFNAAKNFRYDHQFANYIKGSCMFYESDRQRLLSSVFPVSSETGKSYKEQYPILMSNFTVEINKREVENLKLIFTEYCKYNKYKYVKKDPQACSDKRIQAIF